MSKNVVFICADIRERALSLLLNRMPELGHVVSSTNVAWWKYGNTNSDAARNIDWAIEQHLSGCVGVSWAQ